MNDIFISYKVHNRATAIEYYRILKAQGYRVWLDQFVPRNVDWKATIAEQIKNSQYVLCLLSEACLIDDWVSWQINFAKEYQKRIFYVTLDETDWQSHEEYEVENTYNGLDEILLQDLCKEEQEINSEIESIVEEKVHPEIVKEVVEEPKGKRRISFAAIFNFSFLGIITILVFIFGFHFFRIKLDWTYGFILLGILLLSGLSFIKKQFVFFIQAGLGILLLSGTIYFMPSYYISNIEVNGVIFLAFYIFSLLLCYSKRKVYLSLPCAFLGSVVLTALDSAILVFFNLVLDLYFPWLSIIIFFGFSMYMYWSIHDDN